MATYNYQTAYQALYNSGTGQISGYGVGSGFNIGPGMLAQSLGPNFVVGSGIDLDSHALFNSWDYVGYVNYGGNQYLVVEDPVVVGDVYFLTNSPVVDPALETLNTTLVAQNSAFCFLTGTLICTPEGDVPVEDLRIGDQVVTANGDSQQIFWVGKKSMATVFTPSENLPVLISAGALGKGLPKRDLQVMPAHAFLIGDALVVAGQLVNGTSIRRLTHEELGDRFTYFAIETESHSLIIAEGAVSETRGNKKVTARAFDNADEYETLYGEHGRSYPALPHTRYRMGDSLPKSIWESVHGLQKSTLVA